MKKKELVYIICLIAIVTLVIVGVANSKKNKTVGNQVPSANQNTTKTAQEESTKTGTVSHINGDTTKYAKEEEDGSKSNTSEKIKEERTYKNLKITNSRLTEVGGITTLIADVENIGDQATEDMTIFDLIFLDDEDNELVKLVGTVIPLQPGQTTQLNSGITEDIAGAYTYRIVEHQE